MSATTTAFDLGCLRAVTRAINNAGHGQTPRCPYCGAGLRSDVRVDLHHTRPVEILGVNLWCSGKRRCFEITQVLHRPA